jgi:hypothetical protein
MVGETVTNGSCLPDAVARQLWTGEGYEEVMRFFVTEEALSGQLEEGAGAVHNDAVEAMGKARIEMGQADSESGFEVARRGYLEAKNLAQEFGRACGLGEERTAMSGNAVMAVAEMARVNVVIWAAQWGEVQFERVPVPWSGNVAHPDRPVIHLLLLGAKENGGDLMSAASHYMVGYCREWKEVGVPWRGQSGANHCRHWE